MVNRLVEVGRFITSKEDLDVEYGRRRSSERTGTTEVPCYGEVVSLRPEGRREIEVFVPGTGSISPVTSVLRTVTVYVPGRIS
jgi:hypothetical protein